LESPETKLPNQTIFYHSHKVIKEYFVPKPETTKCLLFLSLLKYSCLTIIRRFLGIKTIKISETNHDIVRNLVDDFQKNGRKLILNIVMQSDVSCHSKLLERSK
jgi:hypothetical protein